MKIIQHNRPYVDEKEVTAVRKVMTSGWLLEGKEVASFEEKIRGLTQRKYALAINSGSSAIHISLLALEVGKNHEVIVPTYTDSALLNTIYYTGATPILVDVEKKGFNADPLAIAKKITKKTKAIILPHTFGFPAAIDNIKSFGIPIIEDVAQALGTRSNGEALGRKGDISIFSFYATKMITTGQGGMVVTDNEKYYSHMKDLIHYDQRDNYIVRYNYQMNDIAASIGNVQFEKLDEIIARKKAIAKKYRAVLDKKNLPYYPNADEQHINHYRFLLRFKDENTRDKAQKQFTENHIETIVPFKNFQMFHNLLHLGKKNFPHAEILTKTLLSIPIFASLSEKDIQKILVVMEKIL